MPGQNLGPVRPVRQVLGLRAAAQLRGDATDQQQPGDGDRDPWRPVPLLSRGTRLVRGRRGHRKLVGREHIPRGVVMQLRVRSGDAELLSGEDIADWLDLQPGIRRRDPELLGRQDVMCSFFLAPSHDTDHRKSWPTGATCDNLSLPHLDPKPTHASAVVSFAYCL